MCLFCKIIYNIYYIVIEFIIKPNVFYFRFCCRKYRCVCLQINIQTRKIPQNNRKSQFLEQNSDEGSESEYENEAIIKSIAGRIRGRFVQMKKRFTKMMTSSHQGGTVKVTDYRGMAPRYLYTSLS